MAEAKPSSKKAGLTRGKTILIGGLSIALAAILYIQFGGAGAQPESDAVHYRPPRPAVAVHPTDSPTMPVTLTAAKTGANAAGVKPKDGTSTPAIDETRWKSPPLTAVVAYDPFALPPAFPQAPKMALGAKSDAGDGLFAAAAADDAKKLAEVVEKLRMDLDELKQRGVHVIVRERDEYVAMIGDRMLHVGDDINGFTVTAIDPDGVHIERKESQ